MSDPLAKASATAPPIIGSGCTQRYDPDHLSPELGTDFPGADALWKLYQSSVDESDQNPSAGPVPIIERPAPVQRARGGATSGRQTDDRE